MRFLLVDDEPFSLQALEYSLKSLYPDAETICAGDYRIALEHRDDPLTAAFLDIEMPGMNGIELADALRKSNDQLNVIFVTAYNEYAIDALRLHASGYITKPYQLDAIRQEMEHLRYSVPNSEDAIRKEKPLRVQCFGKFEIWKGNEPLHFERKISKEILAYLIHLKGASASRQDICTALWEDSVEIERKKGYFRSVMASLRKNLKDHGLEDLLVTTRDTYSINMELMDCDYYRYLSGDQAPEVQFRGEYMSQFSWAEEAIGSLTDI